VERPAVSGRRKRVQGIVRFICKHPCHGDKPEVVATARWADSGRLVPLSGVRVHAYEATGNDTWGLKCPCGQNAQMQEYKLLHKAAALFYVTQETSVAIDIMTLIQLQSSGRQSGSDSRRRTAGPLTGGVGITHVKGPFPCPVHPVLSWPAWP
jgi:hypothetical protein